MDCNFSNGLERTTATPPAGRRRFLLTKAHWVPLSLANRVSLCLSTIIAVWRDHTEVLLAERGTIWRREDTRPGWPLRSNTVPGSPKEPLCSITITSFSSSEYLIYYYKRKDFPGSRRPGLLLLLLLSWNITAQLLCWCGCKTAARRLQRLRGVF